MNLENKRVLVTGADGFIGSHLVETLLTEHKCRVRALSLYNSFNNWGWLEDVQNSNRLEVITGDVRDPFLCKEIVKDVDIVFNLAALIAIPYSYVAPLSYVDTNINGTINICQAIKELNPQCILVQTSTSEVYGTAQYVPIDEKHPKQPQSPYSASKISSDALALSYYNSFGMKVIIARPFNTYGPRQSARAVIPTIITQIASGQMSIKVGDLSPTRDFNFVKDTCMGLISLSCCENALGEEVNIGSGNEISIRDTLNLIKKLMKSDVEFVQDSERIRPANSEVFRLLADTSKIQSLTDYRSDFDLERGLLETINWFTDRSNLAKYKSNIYNI